MNGGRKSPRRDDRDTTDEASLPARDPAPRLGRRRGLRSPRLGWRLLGSRRAPARRAAPLRVVFAAGTPPPLPTRSAPRLGGEARGGRPLARRRGMRDGCVGEGWGCMLTTGGGGADVRAGWPDDTNTTAALGEEAWPRVLCPGPAPLGVASTSPGLDTGGGGGTMGGGGGGGAMRVAVRPSPATGLADNTEWSAQPDSSRVPAADAATVAASAASPPFASWNWTLSFLGDAALGCNACEQA